MVLFTRCTYISSWDSSKKWLAEVASWSIATLWDWWPAKSKRCPKIDGNLWWLTGSVHVFHVCLLAKCQRQKWPKNRHRFMEFPAATKGKNSFRKGNPRVEIWLESACGLWKKLSMGVVPQDRRHHPSAGSIFVRCLPRGPEGESTAGGVNCVKPKRIWGLSPYTKKWLQEMGIILLHRTW